MELKKGYLLHPRTEEEGIKLKEEMADCLMKPKQSEYISTITSLTGAIFAIAIGSVMITQLASQLSGFDSLWADGYYCGSAGHVSQESVKRYIQEQEGKKVFDYDIFECPEELKGQLKIGDFFG
jgi:hypothetical protein